MKAELDTKIGRYNESVDPVSRRKTRGTTYEDEFTFQKIDVDYITDPDFATGANYRLLTDENGDRVLFYQYREESPVMVKNDGAYKHDEYPRKDSEEQAFFVLSQLDSMGYVKFWSKK